jgi:cytosine/adenosine deaminase-related metal-dependent hydrolase
VPWEAAFRAITINPARIFDVATEIGSIERGKRADIVIWDGDPLELGTKVQMVFIDGEQIPLRSRKDELRERYMQRVMDMRAAARSNDDLGRSAPSDSPR